MISLDFLVGRDDVDINPVVVVFAFGIVTVAASATTFVLAGTVRTVRDADFSEETGNGCFFCDCWCNDNEGNGNSD